MNTLNYFVTFIPSSWSSRIVPYLAAVSNTCLKYTNVWNQSMLEKNEIPKCLFAIIMVTVSEPSWIQLNPAILVHESYVPANMVCPNTSNSTRVLLTCLVQDWYKIKLIIFMLLFLNLTNEWTALNPVLW